MSREAHALEAAQALIPDDEILDVALTYPRGFTKSQGVGMAVGGLAGMGTDFQGIGVAVGGLAGGSLFSSLKEVPQSLLLAISPTTVYVLGRDRQGYFGGWDSMKPWVKFDRATTRVELGQHLATLDITLTDVEHDVRLELEAKRLGTLDVKALLELMRLSDAHLEGGDVSDEA